MALGKTFTNSLVREVGRNYGKAVSNYLLKDAHSTPIRMVGNDISRKRGRVYHNDLDKFIKKFEIKTARGTLTQCLNIHSSYFALVDEAQADGSIDLSELSFLVTSASPAIKTLERAKSSVIDLGDEKAAIKIEEKMEDIKSFVISLDESLDINELPTAEIPFKDHLLGFMLSIIGWDRLYFKRSFGTVFLALLFPIAVILGIMTGFGTENVDYSQFGEYDWLIKVIIVVGGSIPVWYFLVVNTLSSGGYWKIRKDIAFQKRVNQFAVQIQDSISNLRRTF
jgi:hypothetical protein